MTELEGALKELHLARTAEVEVKSKVKALRDAFEATISEQVAAAAVATAHREGCETLVRAYAVASFRADGNKQPHPGVSIAEQTKLVYTEADAYAWAVERKFCLGLDKKMFEATAKAALDKAPLPFVTVEVVPQAKIATDLTGVV